MAELTLRQQQFVAAITTPTSPTYCKPSAAYRALDPLITPESSWSGASRMLGSAKVLEKVRGQMDVGQMGSKLKKYLRIAETVGQQAEDPSLKLSAARDSRDTIMDYAKLTGQLVEKHEVKTDVGVSILVQRLLQEDRQARPRSVAADGHTLPDSDAESHTNRVEHPGISVAEPSASSEKSSSLLHPTAFVQ